jgi:hypothetical protein
MPYCCIQCDAYVCAGPSGDSPYLCNGFVGDEINYFSTANCVGLFWLALMLLFCSCGAEFRKVLSQESNCFFSVCLAFTADVLVVPRDPNFWYISEGLTFFGTFLFVDLSEKLVLVCGKEEDCMPLAFTQDIIENIFLQGSDISSFIISAFPCSLEYTSLKYLPTLWK